ncbi:hypothetical protein FB451DRAFT_1265786 [Mycena latifolia]|nr:hypothetical protein FB451DRAFT_1265786 [Mycena latifolia]
MMPHFPPEVWMRIFSFVKDNETFKDLALTSRQFHALAREELVRHIYWRTTQDVESNLVHWHTKPRKNRVKDLNIRIVEFPHHVARNTIFALQIFPNLGTLTIRNGRITPDVHAALAQLPRLRRLRLQWCSLYTVQRDVTPSVPPLAVRDLLLHEARIVDSDGEVLFGLESAQFLAQNLALLPLALLQGLAALCISSDQSAARVVHQAQILLPHAQRIMRLNVLGPPSRADPQPAQALVLPLLKAFRGPRCLAAALMRSAAQIAEIALTDEMTAPQALEIIAGLHPHAVRDIELTLTHWDAEVLYEIAHRFTACKRICYVHRYWGPSDSVLFHLGAHHLARMPMLNTLLIHARPRDAVEQAPKDGGYFLGEFDDTYFERRKKWDAEGAAGLRAVPPPPSEEATREYLAVWRKWNPYLEIVSLGERLWTREFRGSAWSADGAGA